MACCILPAGKNAGEIAAVTDGSPIDDRLIDESRRRQLRDEGFFVVPGVLRGAELETVRAALDAAVAETEARQGSAFDVRLDPNPSNKRVYNLPAASPVFVELLRHPAALAAARAVLGEAILVSNFTANVALPGSGSMNLHSDQALVVPPPWLHPWAMNVVWCLDDTDEENGATRYLPGSHRFTGFDEVPADAMERTVAFSAPAGSFIAMEGRLWHTSGRNVSRDRQRRAMFAYYATDFLRPQFNWNVGLPPAVQEGFDDELRALFGLGIAGNTRIGGALTRRRGDRP